LEENADRHAQMFSDQFKIIQEIQEKVARLGNPPILPVGAAAAKVSLVGAKASQGISQNKESRQPTEISRVTAKLSPGPSPSSFTLKSALKQFNTGDTFLLIANADAATSTPVNSANVVIATHAVTVPKQPLEVSTPEPSPPIPRPRVGTTGGGSLSSLAASVFTGASDKDSDNPVAMVTDARLSHVGSVSRPSAGPHCSSNPPLQVVIGSQSQDACGPPPTLVMGRRVLDADNGDSILPIAYANAAVLISVVSADVVIAATSDGATAAITTPAGTVLMHPLRGVAVSTPEPSPPIPRPRVGTTGGGSLSSLAEVVGGKGLRASAFIWKKDGCSVVVKLGSTKTHRRGDGVYVELAKEAPAFNLLQRLFKVRDLHNNPDEFVFCMKRNGKLYPSMKASEKSFRLLVKNTVASIGLNPDLYSGHSCRAGGATDLFAAGIPYYVVKKYGRWSSDTALIYYRCEYSIARSAATAFC